MEKREAFGKLLDAKDRRILYELELNARQGYARIGKKARIPGEVVAYRMARMEKNGVVEGYFTFIDAAKLGYQSVRVYLKWMDAGKKREKEGVEYLVHHPLTWWVLDVQGGPDVAFSVWVRNLDEFYAFWEKFKQKFRGNIGEAQFSIILRESSYPRAYLLNEPVKRSPRVVGTGPALPIDEVDKKILRFIAMNARAPLKEIAGAAGISAPLANYRLRMLVKKKVILGFQPIINRRKLGLLWAKIFVNLNEMGVKREVMKFLEASPNVIYLQDVIGPCDVDIEVEVFGHEGLGDFINSLKERFGESIRSVESFVFTSELKEQYLPFE